MNHPIVEVNKNNIKHKFMCRSPYIENFVTNVFPNWKKETFLTFDMVCNNRECGVAIDLGAWIGTTSIYLAKKFKHVIAVECDTESLIDLENNLKLNDIKNVTVVDKPINQRSTEVIIGPRNINGWNELNLSITCTKNKSTSQNDNVLKSTTFKNIIYNYYLKNKNRSNHLINFIKCNIEGGEEYILEDILYYGLNNNIQSYISFHLYWWDDVSNLLKLSKYIDQYDCFVCCRPIQNVTQYIQSNPTCSILFVPKKNKFLPQKNNMTVCIVSYNNYTYTQNMVKQVSNYTQDIVVINNNSTCDKIINYFNNEYQYTLCNMEKNSGPEIYQHPDIRNILGPIFILTDPDLQLNNQLPMNFITILFQLQQKHKCHKIGFALDIDSDDIRDDIHFAGKTIKEWEEPFWKNKINDDKYELYLAPIDTTFCMINYNYYTGSHVRIAGNFLCKHLPWHKNFWDIIGIEEYKNYLNENKVTTWLK